MSWNVLLAHVEDPESFTHAAVVFVESPLSAFPNPIEALPLKLAECVSPDTVPGISVVKVTPVPVPLLVPAESRMLLSNFQCATRPVVPGGGVVVPAGVVAEALADCADALFAASIACTVYEYVVDGESPVFEYEVVVTGVR